MDPTVIDALLFFGAMTVLFVVLPLLHARRGKP